MIYEDELMGTRLRSGDIIATVDGGASVYGFMFHLIGTLIPGKPDHLALYLGPDNICIEAGPKGVNLFRYIDHAWDADRMFGQRGIVDALYGIGDVVRGHLPEEEEERARTAIRRYALDQAGKDYNYAFHDSDDDTLFYCSQLVYKACEAAGITLDLSSGKALHPLLPDKIITPIEVWTGSTQLYRAED